MARAIAINVGANTTLPGVRGPIYPDGSFEYVPIPERKPTEGRVPTYADLSLETELPSEVHNVAVHLDPEFAGYPTCRRYTYGDEHGVKAGPLSELGTGDYVFFYATLSTAGEPADWMAPEWGAYCIGHFRLARDPVTGDEYRVMDADERAPFRNNAHVKRREFDARVLLLGNESGSRLYDRALPLSSPERGAEPNRIVTDLSADSGKGPWWRRPLRFDDTATERLLTIQRRDDPVASL